MWTLLLHVACIESESGLKAVSTDEDPGPPILEARPEALDFGVVELEASLLQTVSLTSTGGSAVKVTGLAMTGSSAFTLTSTTTEATLAPGDTLDVVVAYSPQSVDDVGSLLVSHDASTSELVVPLSGAGPFADIDVDPSALYFLTHEGEAVTETFVIQSVGTADLDVSAMVVEGQGFSAVGSVPTILPPGEQTTVTVTWDPGGEDSSRGEIWLQTNTAAGAVMVPLAGDAVEPCLGLGQAWDLGWLDVRMTWAGGIEVTNDSPDQEVCMDAWYAYLAEESQDAGGGGHDGFEVDDFPLGPVLAPGESMYFSYGDAGDDQWWCMERSQYTQSGKSYAFTGAHVPDPLLSSMMGGDQEAVWAFMEENPVILVGRSTNYVFFDGSGDSAEVGIRTWNMGEGLGYAEVWETVPAGYTASNFSVAPTWSQSDSAGGMVYGWAFDYEGRVTGDTDEDTWYDVQAVTYTLTAGRCDPSLFVTSVYGAWEDWAGVDRVSTGNPLVLECE